MSCHSFCTKGMARLHMDACHELRFRPTYGCQPSRNWMPQPGDLFTWVLHLPTWCARRCCYLRSLLSWTSRFFRSGETAKQLGPGLTTQAEAWHANATPSGPSWHAATCCGLSLHIQNISETRLFSKAGQLCSSRHRAPSRGRTDRGLVGWVARVDER